MSDITCAKICAGKIGVKKRVGDLCLKLSADQKNEILLWWIKIV